MTIPRRDKGIDLTRAVSEAQAATRGTLSGSNRGGGSAARFKGSLWATDPTLLTYSDLMLAVPDELTSVATALYGMVRKWGNKGVGGGGFVATSVYRVFTSHERLGQTMRKFTVKIRNKSRGPGNFFRACSLESDVHC